MELPFGGGMDAPVVRVHWIEGDQAQGPGKVVRTAVVSSSGLEVEYGIAEAAGQRSE
ncbi:hypothetical protein [Streptosporangium sp. KLBMP 9127]|nr:hypothetical protein [Streptosporangium sp. KLBMP 9127]